MTNDNDTNADTDTRMITIDFLAADLDAATIAFFATPAVLPTPAPVAVLDDSDPEDWCVIG